MANTVAFEKKNKSLKNKQKGITIKVWEGFYYYDHFKKFQSHDMWNHGYIEKKTVGLCNEMWDEIF